MATFLRPLAYRHRWIYDSVTAISSLSVGGVARLRALGLEGLKQPNEGGTLRQRERRERDREAIGERS